MIVGYNDQRTVPKPLARKGFVDPHQAGVCDAFPRVDGSNGGWVAETKAFDSPQCISVAILTGSCFVDPGLVSKCRSTSRMICVQRNKRVEVLNGWESTVCVCLQCRFRLPLQVLSEVVWNEEICRAPLICHQVLSSGANRGVEVVAERMFIARWILKESCVAHTVCLLNIGVYLRLRSVQGGDVLL